MRIKQRLLVLAIFFFQFCGNVTISKNSDCETEVKMLLSNSGYKNSLIIGHGSGGVIPWDSVHLNLEKSGKEYFIQLFFNNEDGREATIAWLALFPEQKLLLDQTIDPEAPDTLIFPLELTEVIQTSCKDRIVDRN